MNYPPYNTSPAPQHDDSDEEPDLPAVGTTWQNPPGQFHSPSTAPLSSTAPVPYTPPQQPHFLNPANPAHLSWLRHKLKDRMQFFEHFAVYLVVNTALFLMWFFLTGGITSYPWFLWVALSWGIAISIHFYTSVLRYTIVEAQVSDPQMRLKVLGKK